MNKTKALESRANYCVESSVGAAVCNVPEVSGYCEWQFSFELHLLGQFIQNLSHT